MDRAINFFNSSTTFVMLLFLSVTKRTWAFDNECATEASLCCLFTTSCHQQRKNKAKFQLIVLDVCFGFVLSASLVVPKFFRGLCCRAFVS
jgi:hypothetical protein